MESLGKERDRDGKVVRQGIAVFGNKGSTDQHAYIQQIRDGIDNSFITFIQVLKDGLTNGIDVGNAFSSGDYLNGFYLGTRHALTESRRRTITIAINEVSPFSVGVLIALFERAVGYYASLVNINAYHQPGVEAGKKAAEDVLKLQAAIKSQLAANPRARFSAETLGQAVGSSDSERVFKICERLAANGAIKCSDPSLAPGRQEFFA
jgi:glucose-6-phosphate isomerase